MGSQRVIGLLASGGIDYVYLDQQHGAVPDARLPELIGFGQRCGLVVLVRVRGADPAAIGFALDCGADGVIVPKIDDAAQAEAAVAACRYPPRGLRSAGGLLGGYAPGAELPPLCFPMIESAEGVRCVEAIADVDGVDGLYMGLLDLSLDLEAAREGSNPDAGLHEAVRAVVDLAGRSRIPVGTSGLASSLLETGFTMITLGSDDAILREGAAALVSTAGGG